MILDVSTLELFRSSTFSKFFFYVEKSFLRFYSVFIQIRKIT